MNPITQRLALYVRDLLAYDEQLIRIGRQNFTREQLEAAYIVVDALGAAELRATSETFDPAAEEITHGSWWSGSATLDFYGDGAYTRALEYAQKQRTQAARELGSTHDVAVYRVSSLTDVKALTGQQYGERVQVALNVGISTALIESALRIDTAQIEVINEQGVQFSG